MAIDPYNIPKRITHDAAKRLTSQQVEVLRQRLHERKQTDELNPAEAAIYCGQCVRTIKRAIDAGKGPKRLKNKDVRESGAVNRHTRYVKAELDAWRASMQSFETITGRFNAFDDLVRDEPWVVINGAVAGHLFDLGDIEDALSALAGEYIEYLRLDEALDGPWTDAGTRERYWAMFRAAVEDKGNAIRVASDCDQLNSSTA